MVADGDLRRSTEENKIQEIRLKFVGKLRLFIQEVVVYKQEEIFVKGVSRIFDIISKRIFQ